jgi:hypothetical protein
MALYPLKEIVFLSEFGSVMARRNIEQVGLVRVYALTKAFRHEL